MSWLELSLERVRRPFDIGRPARETGKRSHLSRSFSALIFAARIFRRAIESHQPVHFLLHIRDLRVADSGEIRQLRDALIELSETREGGILRFLDS